MEIKKIHKAAQLSDDLTRINRAINWLTGKMSGVEKTTIMIHNFGETDIMPEELPDRCNNKILEVLKDERSQIIKEINEL